MRHDGLEWKPFSGFNKINFNIKVSKTFKEISISRNASIIIMKMGVIIIQSQTITPLSYTSTTV